VRLPIPPPGHCLSDRRRLLLAVVRSEKPQLFRGSEPLSTGAPHFLNESGSAAVDRIKTLRPDTPMRHAAALSWKAGDRIDCSLSAP
jgi:hypothetical protein